MSKCIVEGCNSENIHAKDMCAKHYKREWRHGDPLYKGVRKGRSKDLELKERIVIISRKIFTIRGYKKTSLRVLGETIGINHTHIYIYFKNKEDLFNECFKDDPEALSRLK